MQEHGPCLATYFFDLAAYTFNDVWIIDHVDSICCDEAA